MEPGRKVIDFLEEDAPIPGQTFVLVSVVSPKSTQKCDRIAIKIRGVFETKEQAEAHAKRLMRVDNSFDILLAEMGKWLLMPPDVEAIADKEYSEPVLQDLIKAHLKSDREAKELFAARKRELMEKGLDAVLTDEERLPRPADGASLPTEKVGPAMTLETLFEADDPHPATAGRPRAPAPAPATS